MSDERAWQRFAASLRLSTEIRLDFRYSHEFTVSEVCDRCGTTRVAIIAAHLRRVPWIDAVHAVVSDYRSAVEQRRIEFLRMARRNV